MVTISYLDSDLNGFPMLKIGHRGAKGIIRENTLPSIEYAINAGVDAIEIDVHKCATGELVVFHNHSLNRWTKSATRIEDLTLTQIKRKRLRGRHSIPTFDEVLNLVKGRVLLNVELKGRGTAVEVNAVLEPKFKEGQLNKSDFLISSFDFNELRKYRSLDEEIKIGVLYGKKWKEALAVARELKAYSMHPYHKFLKPLQMTRMRAMGYKVFPYTVNKNRDINKMRKLGVDGLFIDYPEKLK